LEWTLFPWTTEGPIAHSQPAYARVPGIRVYGMTCVRATTKGGAREAKMLKKDSKSCKLIRMDQRPF